MFRHVYYYCSSFFEKKPVYEKHGTFYLRKKYMNDFGIYYIALTNFKLTSPNHYKVNENFSDLSSILHKCFIRLHFNSDMELTDGKHDIKILNNGSKILTQFLESIKDVKNYVINELLFESYQTDNVELLMRAIFSEFDNILHNKIYNHSAPYHKIRQIIFDREQKYHEEKMQQISLRVKTNMKIRPKLTKVVWDNKIQRLNQFLQSYKLNPNAWEEYQLALKANTEASIILAKYFLNVIKNDDHDRLNYIKHIAAKKLKCNNVNYKKQKANSDQLGKNTTFCDFNKGFLQKCKNGIFAQKFDQTGKKIGNELRVNDKSKITKVDNIEKLKM